MHRSDVPKPRPFDYDMLKKLVFEHPRWSSYQYAQELTEHKRRKDPAAPAVNLHTVDMVIHRYRAEWEEEEGVKIPPRVVTHYQGYTPPRGTVHPDYRMHTAVKYLRCLGARDSGHMPDDDDEEGWRVMRIAESWEQRMMRACHVVDLDAEGKPFERPARPSELVNGQPIAVAAWAIHGWTTPRKS
jgi:hypothetical protein